MTIVRPKAKGQKPKARQAFTLIELMVVVSIVALFSVLLMVSHQRFGDSIAINSLAYDVALTIREAQIYGTSVRTQELAPDEFEHAYIARFSMDDPTHYHLCVDLTDNLLCNPADNEYLETFEIKRGNKMKDICVVESSTENCDILRIQVAFSRPDPDATISYLLDGGSQWFVAESSSIVLESPTGLEKAVRVTNTGQISVE